jgi:hypothetical protein
MGDQQQKLANRGISELSIRDLINSLSQHQLRIDGIEVTQGIQHYHAYEHLTDPADQGQDNSVRLVANKPAWVRVYVRSIFKSN